MLKTQVDLGVPCLHTQDFQPCMAPGCTVEGKHKYREKKRLRERNSISCKSVSCKHYEFELVFIVRVFFPIHSLLLYVNLI